MLFPILIILILFFLSANLLFYFSVKKAFSKKINRSSDLQISVVVAAKNENENIPDLISALDRQEYDQENFEVIIVDDNSTDKTYETACGNISDKQNFSVIKAGSKTLPGKKGALTIGIAKAQYDFIMITDADCIPQKDWLRTYSAIFSEGYDFIFGVAPFFHKGNKDRQSERSRRLTIVNKSHFDFAQCDNNVGLLSCFENLRSSILTFAAANSGLPYSAAARNFGFKKSSFEKIKGYSNTLETLSGDDDLLLREAVKNKMKIGLATEKGSFVYSKTKNNLRDYLKQKARHTQTSLHYLPLHKIFLASWHLLNLFFLFSPLLFFVEPLFILLFIIKIAMDNIVVFQLQKCFSYNFDPLKIFYLQIIYELSLIVNFINASFGKVDWK